jgi:succinate dehydrogenase/fumarate reductase cytochrome b subunit
MERRFQSYRGTWAWLIQRISAIGLFLLIPMKIYTGWAARDKVPYPDFMTISAKKLHFLSTLSERLDIALLLFFLLHGFYGLRVILIDCGVLREDRWFWRTMILAFTIFGGAVWQVYIREHE